MTLIIADYAGFAFTYLLMAGLMAIVIIATLLLKSLKLINTPHPPTIKSSETTQEENIREGISEAKANA